MKRLWLVCLSLLVLFLAGCENNNTTPKDDDEKITIFTTVYPLQYFTERIAGDKAEVFSIYPPGANEHTFEPSQKDMMALADADLFFYIGLGLEGFVENAQKTLKDEQVKMVATINGIADEELEEDPGSHEEEGHDHKHKHDGHDHGDTDPHIWISPKISQSLALFIKDSLVEKAPEHEEIFVENYEKLTAELKQLDNQYQEMADKAENKTFFVSHAAFGYIANTYGLEQVAIAGLNSQDEPSQKELTKIIDIAKEKEINYILFEQNVSSKLTETIQQEIGAESLVLHNLGVLSKDDVKNKETYFTLMKKNLQTFEKALNNR